MDFLIYEQQIPREVLDGIQAVHQAVFDGDVLKEHKLDRPGLIAVVAMMTDKVVGFKLGYEMEPGIFYSWLGGVQPDYRKQGIAQQLMMTQHEHCQKLGYRKIRTYGRNVRKAMLILNLKSGFDIVETFVDTKGRHKIVFEKNLSRINGQ